jgi:filamentous hemagglutinin family protein
MRTASLLAAAVAAAFVSPGLAQVASTTLPSGQQHGGGISVSTTGAEMTVTQSTAREIIKWQSFSIGSGAHVRFQQPGASSVVLNRVVGNSASEIFGRLTSNGQVFLTNPNGVLFAPGASVEVGSLLATTLSISDQDFLNGVYRFQNAGGAGSVVNKGNIKIATPNGYAALAGPRIENSGMIVAELGTIAFAAGDRVTLDMVGDALINVSVDQSALNASIVNSGTIEANGGRVLMTARTANTLLDTVINSSGVIRANRLAERDGEVVLDGNGLIDVAGIIEASGTINVNMPESPGPVIQPIPPVLPLPPLQPGTVVVQEPFNIGAGGTLTLTSGGNVTTIAHPITLAGPTVTATNANGVTLSNTAVPEAVEAVKPMPQSGSVSVTGTGTLAPMQHSIEGAGVNAPAGVTLVPR